MPAFLALVCLLVPFFLITPALHAQGATSDVEAIGSDGTSIVLTADVGACQGSARVARWLPPGGKPSITGCWRPIGAATGEIGAQIAWADGDVTQLPLSRFAPVKRS